MKITARLDGEDEQLVETMTNRGITAKLVKGGVIVDLQLAGCNSYTYEIPWELGDATLLINVAERGGGWTKTGSGTVVCGLSGKPLWPYYVPRRGHLACETHAYFCVPSAVVTITGYRRDNTVMIEEHRIIHTHHTDAALIESEKLWEGELEELPKTFSRFKAAAEAAYKKGNCYHCRHVHYAAEAKPEAK